MEYSEIVKNVIQEYLKLKYNIDIDKLCHNKIKFFNSEELDLIKSQFQLAKNPIILYYFGEGDIDFKNKYFIFKFYENENKITIINLEDNIDIIIEKILLFLLNYNQLKNSSNLLTYFVKNNKRWKLKNNNIFLNDISENFKNESYHSILQHRYKTNLDSEIFNVILNKKSLNKKLYKMIEDEKKAEICFDIGFSIVQNPYKFEGLKILFIDDNKNSITSLIEWIYKIFPELKWEFYLLPNFKNINKKFDIEINVFKIIKKENEFNFEEERINLEEVSCIFVDLLFHGQSKGIDYIRQLVSFRRIRNSQYNNALYFDIFAFSRSTDVEDIQRSLKEGALYFIPKSNVLRLPGIVAMFEKYRGMLKEQKEKSKNFKYDKYRGFAKTYSLPNSVLRKIHVEPFVLAELAEKQLEKCYEIISKLWIKRLPKADIHYHLGGSMTADIVFNLSLNSLRYLSHDFNWNKAINIVWEFLKKEIGDSKIIDFFHSKTGNEVDSFFDSLWEELNKEYCDIERFQVLNLFNVIMGIIDGKDNEYIKSFWQEVVDALNLKEDKILKYITMEISYKFDKFRTINNNKKESFFQELEEIFDKIKEQTEKIINFNIPETQNILQNLIKYDEKKSGCKKDMIDEKTSKNRRKCLPYYLKGSGFTGSELLQFYENILAAVFHLSKNAFLDNVRYLEIRCSPDGYTKKQLSLQDAIEALFDGADLFSRYLYIKEKKFIWTNFIFTAKRHKEPEDLAIEIGSALTNMKRNNLEIFQKDVAFVEYNYKWKRSRLVGIDLAGLENKETRPGKFQNDFLSVSKASFPVTVHAGEQDTHLAIWEAIYLLHARRIGHGLSLVRGKSLLNMIKNANICVEINPYSNIFTNPALRGEHPIYDFFNAGINIAIGTDDKALSGTELSDEFVLGAKLYLENKNNKNKVFLTKWDVLKLIKNAFSSAFIHKGEKRDLLIAVENEIYDILSKINR